MSLQFKIAILTNTIPSYREGFYNQIFANPDMKVTVFCQDNVPGFNYNTIHHKYPDNVHIVNFVAASKEKIVWQFLPFWRIIRDFDIVFIDGNPRIISQALLATFLRMIGKKVVIWSMVHSCWNKSFTESIRINWLRIFKNHFVYNDNDVKLLVEKGFNNKVIVGMNNGLNQTQIDKIISKWSVEALCSWKEENNIISDNIVISSGRLFEGKYELVLEALAIIKNTIPDILWICIGDGTAREGLKIKAQELGVSSNCLFLGAIYDDEALAPYFLASKIFVHPTAVGLSIMHAFGFGLPIITHDNINEHGPEIIAFEDEINGLSYEHGNVSSFSDKVKYLLLNQGIVDKMSLNAKTIAQKKYNTNVMYQRFLEMVQNLRVEKYEVTDNRTITK
jgi:glycosyltransferase involved in cell wall biosynthesis